MPELTENARRVLDARYLRRDAERRIIETPEQLFERVARAVAEAELLLGSAAQAARWEAAFHELMDRLDFLPNTPTLMNAGTPLGQLAACFVLPVGDSMEEIFEALKQMALVQRTGGGTGFSFSRLRPRGATLLSTGGTTPGPIAFMKVFDCATENVKLGGRRRGANMGILRVDHPDILEFIEAKLGGRALRNFNISVGTTDAFMEAAERGAEYDLVDPRDGARVRTLNAGEVFERIVDAAWRTGDPGLVFLDAINRANPTPHVGVIEATNPCGEIPLLPYESCNLGSIHLGHMVRVRDGRAELDREKLRATVRTAVRFLDDVIEVGRFPVPAIERITRANRKIGLGVMGFADLLIRLGVSYDSDEAVRVADDVMGLIAGEAREASAALAAERGVFPNWRGSVHEREGRPVRNATQTAIAPTGTISIIAGASASIEPLFALAYRRSHVLEEQTLHEVNPLFLRAIDDLGLDADALVAAVLETGSLRDAPGVPDALKHLFVTALEIPPERHLEIQAAFQRHVDNSVSKTVNLPESATPDDVARIYRRAWTLGLKGITLYRYGSKDTQVLEIGRGERAAHYDHGTRCDPAESRV
ncbi:MAG TPA: adenosylcobalamin-dependent ribonucleoside-diphosphate reductase [Longimicrobiales bacterium]